MYKFRGGCQKQKCDWLSTDAEERDCTFRLDWSSSCSSGWPWTHDRPESSSWINARKTDRHEPLLSWRHFKWLNLQLWINSSHENFRSSLRSRPWGLFPCKLTGRKTTVHSPASFTKTVKRLYVCALKTEEKKKPEAHEQWHYLLLFLKDFCSCEPMRLICRLSPCSFSRWPYGGLCYSYTGV